MFKLKYKKVNTQVPTDTYISKIDSIIGKVKNVTIKAIVKDFKIYELEDTIFSILKLEDNSSKISVLLVGNNDNDFKKIIKSIKVNNQYLINGSITLIDNDFVKEFETLFKSNISIKEYIIEDKILCVRFIEEVNDDKISLFGIDIVELYDYDLDSAYDFINKNTDYLSNIKKEEVKQIIFSYYKDIIILLNNGLVLLNGNKKFENIDTLHFLNGTQILAISKDKIIFDVLGFDNSIKFINNNNYKYKKIILHILGIVALTYENEIRAITPCNQVAIDYTRFYDIEDIGYVEENDDIVVIKNDKVYSLFCSYDYSNTIPDVMVGGNLESIYERIGIL